MCTKRKEKLKSTEWIFCRNGNVFHTQIYGDICATNGCCKSEVFVIVNVSNAVHEKIRISANNVPKSELIIFLYEKNNSLKILSVVKLWYFAIIRKNIWIPFWFLSISSLVFHHITSKICVRIIAKYKIIVKTIRFRICVHWKY